MIYLPKSKANKKKSLLQNSKDSSDDERVSEVCSFIFPTHMHSFCMGIMSLSLSFRLDIALLDVEAFCALNKFPSVLLIRIIWHYKEINYASGC